MKTHPADDFEDSNNVYEGATVMNEPAKKSDLQVIERAPGIAHTPMDMIARAIEAGSGMETVEKLMGLQERWEANKARKAFDAAISEAKAKIPPITRNATGHNSKKYADFAAIARVVDPILAAHGLSYRFRSTQVDKISVTCVLAHRDGHSEESTLCGPADTSGNKNAIQAIGSTLTYLQRYSLVQALGLAAAEDDDGKAGAAGEKISADEAQNLRDMLTAKKANEPAFLKWAKAQKIEDIPADYYDSCVEAIKALKAPTR